MVALSTVAVPTSTYAKSSDISSPLHTLDVQKLTQPYSNWCWATCGATVVNYIKKTTIEPKTFAYALQNNYANNTANMSKVKKCLSNKYGISSLYYENTIDVNLASGKFAVRSSLSYSKILNSLQHEYPLIIGWAFLKVVDHELKIKNPHVVVICGYMEESGVRYVAYMDPAYGKIFTTTYEKLIQLDNRYWTESLCNIKKA